MFAKFLDLADIEGEDFADWAEPLEEPPPDLGVEEEWDPAALAEWFGLRQEDAEVGI